MTNTSPIEKTLEISTVVEVDWEKQEARIKNPSKSKATYTVYKPRDGSAFFRVKVDESRLPDSLSGRFSTLLKAVEHTTEYLRLMKESFSVRSDRLDKERKERHAAKLAAKDGEHVQQGSDH
jgi:hypothetical protein